MRDRPDHGYCMDPYTHLPICIEEAEFLDFFLVKVDIPRLFFFVDKNLHFHLDLQTNFT